jgi:glucose/arabinose dehydrogenase
MFRIFALFVLALFSTRASSQPTLLLDSMSVSATASQINAVRIDYDPISEQLWLAGLSGDLVSVSPDPANHRLTIRYRSDDHGVPAPLMGMDIASDGTIYLVGNDAGSQPGYNIGIVRRGVPDGQGTHDWQTVATTVPYPRSATPFDHNMNAIVLSPDGQWLYINSGSRTDHGELQENNGQFPGSREVPLTSAILRIPADGSALVLEDDLDWLIQQGILFADGTRNSFSLAFDGQGRLFGTENSGDRDDEEEINLLEEGRHYGFPWRMGLTDTPMQFSSYDPAADLLLNPSSYAVQNGHFYNDPTYPAPPAGVVFVDPVRNLGPHANLYRDPLTGAILDADDTGQPLATLTSHRSPLGLVFDVDNALPHPLTGDALVLSWTGPESDLLSPYAGEGEDLLHITLADGPSGPVAAVDRIATGFTNPIDAVLVDGFLYVLEYGSNAQVWQIGFGGGTATEDPVMPASLEVDLWPNPAAGRRSVRISTPHSGRVVAKLFAVDGREVMTVADQLAASGDEITIAVASDRLPAGIYFLMVTAGSSRHVQAVFVQ